MGSVNLDNSAYNDLCNLMQAPREYSPNPMSKLLDSMTRSLQHCHLGWISAVDGVSCAL